jgi:ferredoxin
VQVRVQKNKCIGSGACVTACGSVFAIGDDGFVVLLDEQPTEDLREQVEDAADACPAAVISTG